MSGRDARRLGLAGERQAAERTMQIVGRQLFAARDDFGDAIEACQQRLQLRRHLEHDLARPCRASMRHIARELHGVAEPLLGVQQDGLAAERRLAEPWRLPKLLARDHAGALPAPFVFRKAARVVADASAATAPR